MKNNTKKQIYMLFRTNSTVDKQINHHYTNHTTHYKKIFWPIMNKTIITNNFLQIDTMILMQDIYDNF